MPVVTGLFIYPVKSMQRIPLERAVLTVQGLKYDRNWMIVDENGTFITQRDMPVLASIKTEITTDSLRFRDKSKHSFSIPLNGRGGSEIVTEVWGQSCKAVDEGDAISEWLTEKVGQHRQKALRLVRFKENYRRDVEPDYLKGEEAHTKFADGYPFLITSEESLSMLNDRLVSSGAYPVSMDRFRPNIVIRGLQPFKENDIEELQSQDGSLKFGLRKPCKRCKVTTVDQDSGRVAEPGEPLRTLTMMKTVPGMHGAFFGQNATLLSGEGLELRRGGVLEVVA